MPDTSSDRQRENEHIERLLEKAERELSMLELDEITHGLSPEELEARGFTEKGTPKINRSAHTSTIRHGNLTIDQLVQYHIDTGKPGTPLCSIHDLVHLSEVTIGQRLASKKIPSKHLKKANLVIEDLVDAEYSTTCNCYLSLEKEELVFTSALAGKVVIRDESVYIIPIDKDGTVTCTIQETRMQAVISLYPSHGSGRPLIASMVQELLANSGIRAGILLEKITQLVTEVQKLGTPCIDEVIALGKPPVNGRNAEAVFLFSTEATFDNFSILPDGRIDYRKQANIKMVSKGDILAKITPAALGIDGYDIYGVSIPCTPGETNVLCPGENVVMSKDGLEFIAESDGFAAVNNSVISVFPHFIVDGDVDYACGNIDFNGNVTIKGSVLPGFEVRASGDIIILKNIDNGIVLAGRDLKVAGGIIGSNALSIISAGRDLHAHHIQNARIEAQGDIYIHNSCLQSDVSCTGTIHATEQKGILLGGKTIALKGIVARTLGSPYGARTEIEAGSDYLVTKKLSEFDEALAFFSVNIEKIETVVSPLIELLKKGLTLGNDKKAKLNQIMLKRSALLKSRSILEMKRKELALQKCSCITAVIRVQDAIYPDVLLRILDRTLIIKTEEKHCAFSYSAESDTIVKVPF